MVKGVAKRNGVTAVRAHDGRSVGVLGVPGSELEGSNKASLTTVDRSGVDMAHGDDRLFSVGVDKDGGVLVVPRDKGGTVIAPSVRAAVAAGDARDQSANKREEVGESGLEEASSPLDPRTSDEEPSTSDEDTRSSTSELEMRIVR